MPRDLLLEDELLTFAGELNERHHAEQPGPYMTVVRRRLTEGAATYGDDAYVDRDNLAEALEESPDAGAYLLLELQRLRGRCGDDDWQEMRMATVAAIAAAVHLDVAIRRVAVLRQELGL